MRTVANKERDFRRMRTSAAWRCSSRLQKPPASNSVLSVSCWNWLDAEMVCSWLLLDVPNNTLWRCSKCFWLWSSQQSAAYSGVFVMPVLWMLWCIAQYYYAIATVLLKISFCMF